MRWSTMVYLTIPPISMSLLIWDFLSGNLDIIENIHKNIFDITYSALLLKFRHTLSAGITWTSVGGGGSCLRQ